MHRAATALTGAVDGRRIEAAPVPHVPRSRRWPGEHIQEANGNGSWQIYKADFTTDFYP